LQQNNAFDNEKLNSLVKGFFHKIHADDLLQNLFKDHDQERIQHHPQTFLSHGFGENQYSQTQIADAHKQLSISDEHFESMVNHFITTLDENGYSEEERNKVREVLRGYKNDVTGKA
jgi:hemoglobin